MLKPKVELLLKMELRFPTEAHVLIAVFFLYAQSDQINARNGIILAYLFAELTVLCFY